MDTRSADGSGRMFDRIAQRYDLLNRLLSLGLDRSWRRRLVATVSADARRVLDVATGTADVALAIADARPEAMVVGLDPSTEMLAVGQAKLGARADRVRLVEGDVAALPFPDDHFDATTVAFGVRNFPDRPRGLAEMARVTRPGGTVAVLELTEPREGLLAPLTRFHVHHVVPRLGAWLSGDAEYRYLQQSVAAFPPPPEFAAMMEAAGLESAPPRAMRFGVAHLYVGTNAPTPTGGG